MVNKDHNSTYLMQNNITVPSMMSLNSTLTVSGPLWFNKKGTSSFRARADRAVIRPLVIGLGSEEGKAQTASLIGSRVRRSRA